MTGLNRVSTLVLLAAAAVLIAGTRAIIGPVHRLDDGCACGRYRTWLSLEEFRPLRHTKLFLRVTKEGEATHSHSYWDPTWSARFWFWEGSTKARPQSVASIARVEWKPDPAEANRWRVEVSGLEKTQLTPDQLQDALAVYAEQGSLVEDLNLPPMLGRHEWRDGTLVFTPEFPLQPGLGYRAVFRAPGVTNAASVIARLRVPAVETTPSTTVSAVYPSANELPENLLKFYLHFSAPMSRGHIYDHIHLLDARGERIELPFLEIDEELWNPEMTRLTLFIDPGRIKRGVKPLEEIGPSLEAGNRYTLVIDREWRDAAGQPLVETFRREFAVIAPDRTPPDPKRWTIRAPAAGGRDALVVRFDEPLDAALAQRLIRVRAGDRDLALAETRLGDGERELRLVPADPWPRGELQLTVVTTIEDLAGNNVGKPFEVDLFEGVERRISRELVTVPFVTR